MNKTNGNQTKQMEQQNKGKGEAGVTSKGVSFGQNSKKAIDRNQ